MITDGTLLGGRYVIETRIGEGAMGAVYRARHADVGRLFAIKVLHRSHQPDGRVLARFRREAELAGRLRQENVVSVVDMGLTPDGEHFLVMDFAPGDRLCDMLDGGILGQARVLDLLRQLCAGLQHAHEARLIHRDFKPENVIVESLADGRDHARIVDFGIAILGQQPAIHDEGNRLTEKGMVVGTPQYMAPEQARGDSGDHRIDLYALGVVAYELLCGALPFDGTGVEVAYQNVHSPTPPMSTRAPGVFVDAALEAFARKLLEKDPAKRFPDARAAREWLELYARDRTAAATKLGVEERAKNVTTNPFEDGTAPGRTRSAQVSVQPYEHLLEPARQEADVEPFIAEQERTTGRRRMALAIAGVLGLALLVTLIGVGRRDKSSPAAQQVAAVPSEPPIVQPAPVAPAPAVATPDAALVETPAPPPVVVPAPPVRTYTVAKNKAAQGSASETPAARAPTTDELSALYASVGRALTQATKNDETSTLDLWPRYRWIRFMEAAKTPESRTRAAEILKRLQDDLRAIKR